MAHRLRVGHLIERCAYALGELQRLVVAQKCMKNSRGCSLSLWLWSAVTSIPFARKARLTGLTSVDARTKSQGGHRTIEIPAKPKSDRRNQGQGDERRWFRRRLGVIQLRKAPRLQRPPTSGSTQAPGPYKAFCPSTAHRPSSSALSVFRHSLGRRLGEDKCLHSSEHPEILSGETTSGFPRDMRWRMSDLRERAISSFMLWTRWLG